MNDINLEGQIFHNGDTNTYHEFNAADQWRVVTGGTQRLQVDNTNTIVSNNLIVSGTIASSNPIGAVKAWVNFQGTGTITSFSIRGDLNVSSITDLGVGQYRINFSSALDDANYAVNAMATAWATTAAASSIGLRASTSPANWEGTPTTMTSSAVDIVHSNSTNVTAEDVSYMMVSVFR
jgi:hypothetical protein